MMQIHTVAAGGGSILHFDGARFRVGPDSAGANPGPASYRRGGPLAVTDCNVMLGRLNPDFFPRIFGRNADQKLDRDIVAAKFAALAEEISASSGKRISAEEAAEGFMKIAVANMANAIKEISIQRGYDVSRYTLACFGGAGGQHACRVADELGMKRIFLHPFAGVLSAYGMGLADVRALRHRTIETQLSDAAMPTLTGALDELAREGEAELLAQGIEQSAIEIERHVHIKYAGTDAPLLAAFGDVETIKASFEEAHRRQLRLHRAGQGADRRFRQHRGDRAHRGGGRSGADFSASAPTPSPRRWCRSGPRARITRRRCWTAPRCVRARKSSGPAIVLETTSTTIVEPGWTAVATARGHLVLERRKTLARQAAIGTDVDPVMLEIFNNLFMSIAEQMGSTLEKTSYSVNIKERLDFSCALFDQRGQLIANAPHMPVHLGSMGEIGGNRHPRQSRCDRQIHHHAGRCLCAERAL